MKRGVVRWQQIAARGIAKGIMREGLDRAIRHNIRRRKCYTHLEMFGETPFEMPYNTRQTNFRHAESDAQ